MSESKQSWHKMCPQCKRNIALSMPRSYEQGGSPRKSEQRLHSGNVNVYCSLSDGLE